MSVQITDILNPTQKAQIQSIVNASKEKEPVTVSFPVEDADFYVFYESKGSILSAAAFTEESPECYECCAFTAPDHRGRGLFTTLLDEASSRMSEDSELIFYTDGKSKDTLAVLRALEAELVLEEHMMEISLYDFSLTNPAAVPSEITMDETVLDSTKTYRYTAPCGTLYISVFPSSYYLYGFEIKEELRRKGYGKQFLLYVLNDLAARNPLPLRLQVSGKNIPALSLYKKTGFRLTETLSGYLY